MIEETFRGYAPDLGYDFLRNTTAENDYRARGCSIDADEIFISSRRQKVILEILQEIFGRENKIAVCDPVYPVYVNRMLWQEEQAVIIRKGRILTA